MRKSADERVKDKIRRSPQKKECEDITDEERIGTMTTRFSDVKK